MDKTSLAPRLSLAYQMVVPPSELPHLKRPFDKQGGAMEQGYGMDNTCNVGSVMMDLSRAFDSMPRGLLLAKLKAYGVDENSCKILCSYLSNRSQRVKICNTHSDWLCTYRGFHQGSGLGPLLYNIFGNDLFY
jgi:hypothetical protein